MSTVGSNELRTGEKKDTGICIKEEVDELDIEESQLLYETETKIRMKEEFLPSEDNGESYKYLSVKLADMKYQNNQQTLSTVGSNEQLRTGEKKDNEICIKEEIDELDIEESQLLYETESNIGIKEEFSTSENSANIEFCHVYVKCESIPSDSEVSLSRVEDTIHEGFKYSSSNSKTNNLSKPKEEKVTEKYKIKKSKKFQCAICNREYPHKMSLQYHLKVHSGIRDYKCSLCSKSFFFKSALIKHETIHTGLKKYECTICKKMFTYKSNMIEHEKIHIGIKNYECAICKKKYMQKSHLVEHEKIHTGIKNYECLICNKKFMYKSSLVEHKKIHKGYECSICKKKFTQIEHLVEHETTHRGIRDYECTICKKKFMYKSTLGEHEKIHTGIKNYECSVCKKKFLQKCHLIEHEKIHTGIKNFECSICKKKFMNKSHLVRHEKIHSNSKN